MTTKTYTASICTLSWIDQRAKLPEKDGDGPPTTISGHKVTREDDALPFRFINLLEATIAVTGSCPPRIVSHNWAPASKIYQNPSFGKFKSEAFETRRSIAVQNDRVCFRQTAGARTVSPEVIAELVGAGAGALGGGPVMIPIGEKLGRKVGHEFLGFPPIWTTLELTIFADGRSEGALVCYSLFPSVSYYKMESILGAAAGGMSSRRETSVYKLVGRPYDAVPNLQRWKTDGWGSLQPNPSGPCSGNPWGFAKTDLTVRPVDSGTRVV